MKYEILGTTMQTLRLHLDAGESVYTETAALLGMSGGIQLKTTFTGGGARLGGLVKRALTGNSLTLNRFISRQEDGEVMLATRIMGHILPVHIQPEHPLFVQKHSFLCAQEDVALGVGFALNWKGLLGGNGILFNKVSGEGTAFLSIDGELIEYNLTPGQIMYVHAGHLAAYECNVKYKMEIMRGFKNFFFGNDGIALIKLTGPGKVWLHSFTIVNLAEALIPYLPQKSVSLFSVLG